jgi:predicted flap endonuclease-1-like 5' DNA nuclease
MLSARRSRQGLRAEVHVTWFIGQSVFIIATAFLLGILVGWLIWGRILRPDRAASEASEPASDAASGAARAAVEPESIAAAAEPAAVPERATAESVPAPRPEPELEPVAVEPEPELVLAAVAAEPASAPNGAAPVVTVQAAPVVMTQATAPEIEQPSDDLERIEGIGPMMAGAMIKSGIRTYTQLAAADQGTLRNAIEAQGLRFAPSIVTWSRQAQLLADGDEAGFEDLARRLVAGRDEGRE